MEHGMSLLWLVQTHQHLDIPEHYSVRGKEEEERRGSRELCISQYARYERGEAKSLQRIFLWEASQTEEEKAAEEEWFLSENFDDNFPNREEWQAQ